MFLIYLSCLSYNAIKKIYLGDEERPRGPDPKTEEVKGRGDWCSYKRNISDQVSHYQGIISVQFMIIHLVCLLCFLCEIPGWVLILFSLLTFKVKQQSFGEDFVTSTVILLSLSRSLTVVIEQMEQFSSRLGELSSRVESTHEHTAHGLEQGARHRDEQLRSTSDTYTHTRTVCTNSYKLSRTA